MESYQQLLLSDEWRRRREEILIRDKNMCSICQNFNLVKDTKVALTSKLSRKNMLLLKIFELKNYFTVFQDERLINKLSEETLSHVIVDSDNRISVIGIRKLLVDEEIEYIQKPLQFQIDKAKQKIDSYLTVNALSEDLSKYLMNYKKNKEFLNYYFGFENDQSEELYWPTPQMYYESGFKNLNWYSISGLHVHHKYYQEGKMPWEYNDSGLTTLCWICHENLHKNARIPFLDKDGIEKGTLTYCSRCYGAGWFPEYRHVHSGICFKCNGARYEEFV